MITRRPVHAANFTNKELIFFDGREDMDRVTVPEEGTILNNTHFNSPGRNTIKDLQQINYFFWSFHYYKILELNPSKYFLKCTL